MTIFIITGIQSQVVIINENCTSAYSNILSLKFDDAQEQIEEEKIKNPQNIFIPYLENYIDFLKVIISEDENVFYSLEKNIPNRIKQIEKLNDTSRFKKYLIGNINLQWALARSKFNEYPTAAIEINKAYRLLKSNNELFPDFIPNSITLGVLHIMIGIVPDTYHWILDLISMQGSVELGQRELKFTYEECLSNPKYYFLKDEVLFYMGMVGLNLNPDPVFADYLISRLKQNDHQNLILTYLTINALMKTGKNDEALKTFSTIDTTENYYPFYYLNFLHGECYLRELNFVLAEKQFNYFLQNFTGQNFIKDAWQKLAWIAILRNDTLAYYRARQHVLSEGTNKIDTDKSAELYAKRGTIPNAEMLKSRLLFDGGYYNKAQNILINQANNNLTPTEKVEKDYRLGRIAHQLHNYSAAKNYYLSTIETGSYLPDYYAANAALKLGNIYEVENDSIRAAHYYNICLHLDFDEYRNSIRGKAKQGLKRMSAND